MRIDQSDVVDKKEENALTTNEPVFVQWLMLV